MRTRQKDTRQSASRRDVLKLAGATVPLAAVAVVTGQGAEAATVEGDGGGLRDTAHVRKYFETARF